MPISSFTSCDARMVVAWLLPFIVLVSTIPLSTFGVLVPSWMVLATCLVVLLPVCLVVLLPVCLATQICWNSEYMVAQIFRTIQQMSCADRKEWIMWKIQNF